MSGSYIDLDGKSFDDFVKSGISVVDFWAEWCGPCRMMGPIFESAAQHLKDKAHFGKVNVDQNQELAQKFGVMSIPTIVFFKNGEPVDRAVGVVEEEELGKKIESLS